MGRVLNEVIPSKARFSIFFSVYFDGPASRSLMTSSGSRWDRYLGMTAAMTQVPPASSPQFLGIPLSSHRGNPFL